MDHFNILQLCQHCRRGKKVFKNELSFYDADGSLNLSRAQISRDFSFTGKVCCRISIADFYSFSNRQIIVQLKRQNEIRNNLKDMVQLYIWSFS